MKHKLKWYAPLNRWLTEEEHRAHVAVEPELSAVYASIAANAIPADLIAPQAQAQSLYQLQAMQNSQTQNLSAGLYYNALGGLGILGGLFK